MAQRLTHEILEAIILMGNQIDAGGFDEIQGCETEAERIRIFDDCMKAADWAAQELHRRESRRRERREGPPSGGGSLGFG